jgi:hypothetical protein
LNVVPTWRVTGNSNLTPLLPTHIIRRGPKSDRSYGRVADYSGMSDENIGRRRNLPFVSKSTEEAAEHFGFLGHFLSVDIPASSALTQKWLGWSPTRPGLIPDLDHARYFEA